MCCRQTLENKFDGRKGIARKKEKIDEKKSQGIGQQSRERIDNVIRDGT